MSVEVKNTIADSYKKLGFFSTSVNLILSKISATVGKSQARQHGRPFILSPYLRNYLQVEKADKKALHERKEQKMLEDLGHWLFS